MKQGTKLSKFKRMVLYTLLKFPFKKVKIAQWLNIHRTTLYRYERNK